MPQTERKISSNYSGIQAYNLKKVCPKCGRKTLCVGETRKVVDGVRRRYHCEHCGHRCSRYEVSSESYEELLELRRVVGKIRSLLSNDKATACPCYNCSYYGEDGCSFTLPEAGSADAEGCSYYESKN